MRWRVLHKVFLCGHCTVHVHSLVLHVHGLSEVCAYMGSTLMHTKGYVLAPYVV